MHAESLKLCSTLLRLNGLCSPSGSAVHGLWGSVLEWTKKKKAGDSAVAS